MNVRFKIFLKFFEKIYVLFVLRQFCKCYVMSFDKFMFLVLYNVFHLSGVLTAKKKSREFHDLFYATIFFIF